MALRDPTKQAAYRTALHDLYSSDPGVTAKNKLLGLLREGSMDRQGDWSLDLLAGLYTYAQSCSDPQQMMANQFKGLWDVYTASKAQAEENR